MTGARSLPWIWWVGTAILLVVLAPRAMRDLRGLVRSGLSSPVASHGRWVEAEWRFLSEARWWVPEGATYTVRGPSPDEEMRLYMLSLGLLPHAVALPSTYYTRSTANVGGRAEYLLRYGPEPQAGPWTELVTKALDGAVLRRHGSSPSRGGGLVPRRSMGPPASARFLMAVVLAGLLLGLPLCAHPELRSWSAPARWCLSGLLGLAAGGFGAVLISLSGFQWTSVTMLVVVLPPAAVVTGRWLRTGGGGRRRQPAHWSLWVVLCWLATLGCFSLLSSRGVSIDLMLFWGVKAVRWALDCGLDLEFLRSAHAAHTHVAYPPLWPAVLSVGVRAAGGLPWHVVPLLSLGLVVVAAPVIHELMEPLVGRASSGLVALWATSMTVALIESRSGGNAEALLVVYLSIAVAALAAEEPGPSRSLIAGLALAGAVLTKNEGAVAAGLLVVGCIARDLIRQQPGVTLRSVRLALPAAVTFMTWSVARLVLHLPLVDPARERLFDLAAEGSGIAGPMVSSLAGPLALVWVIAVVAVLTRGGHGLSVRLPALVLAIGLVGFAAGYYLHIEHDPSTMIRWTFPRLTLPGLSALILAAGIGTASRPASADG